MAYAKICPNCKNVFIRTINSQKFCSPACREAAYVRKKECPVCHKEFVSKTLVYCSTECMQSAMHMPSQLKRKKPRLSIEEVVRLSREAGMTYGKYVQLHSLS